MSVRELHRMHNQDVRPFEFLSKSNGFFKEIQAFLSMIVEFESINFKSARFWSVFELRIRFPAFAAISTIFSIISPISLKSSEHLFNSDSISAQK